MGIDGSGYVFLVISTPTAKPYPISSPLSSNQIHLYLQRLTQTPPPNFQIWEYFLAYSTIISRQGSATCYQITLVKNINSTHRIEGVPSQFGLMGALASSSSKVHDHDDDDAASGGAKSGLGEQVRQVLRSE